MNEKNNFEKFYISFKIINLCFLIFVLVYFRDTANIPLILLGITANLSLLFNAIQEFESY